MVVVEVVVADGLSSPFVGAEDLGFGLLRGPLGFLDLDGYFSLVP